MDLTQGHPVFSPALGRKISVDSLRAGMSLLALSGLAGAESSLKK
jgi:hypothetical protein